MKIRAIITAVCIFSVFISCFILPTASISAETKTFIKEYTYQAGDEDSKNSCRVIALREVKRLLLEELGTYLEAETEVKNFQMTKDQIVTLTAGIVRTELIEEKWNTANFQYWLKAKITANPQDVTKAIDTLRKDRAKVKELEGLRKKSEELLKENERLTNELKTAKGNEKTEAAKAYKQNIDNLSATEWFERGSELVLSGNHTEAVKAFSKAIELNPQDAETYYKRGNAYRKLGNYRQVVKDYSKAIALYPQYPAAYISRGDAYANLGNYRQVVKDCSKAIELDPQYSFAYISRGDAYYNLGNYRQAIKDYSKAIALYPQYPAAYISRGDAYGEIGDYQQAIKDYNRAIELNPQDAKAYNNRRVAYDKLGNHQLAEAYNNRGISYNDLGNYQQAIKDYKIAARLGLKSAQNYLGSKGIEW